MPKKKQKIFFTKFFNPLIKILFSITIATIILFPAFTPEMYLRGAIFFQVNASNLHCKIKYEHYTLLDTRNYVDAPALTTFGHGFEVGNIFKIGNNTITLIAEPVDEPKMPLVTDHYCAIRLYVGIQNNLEEASYYVPLNIAYDNNHPPYSLDKFGSDFPNPETDPRNEISINYHSENLEEIISITLEKNIDFQLY